MLDFIRSMPKAELHCHLEGTIQPELALELARRNGKLGNLPSENIEGLKDWFKFVDFPHFVKIIMAIQDLPQNAEDFALVVYECGKAMAEQNILYRELTVTPYNHTHVYDKNLSIDDLLRGLDDGRLRAKNDFDVEMRWVFDIGRNLSFLGGDVSAYDPIPAQRTLEYALIGQDIGVVGLGLGGYEVNAPPEPFAHAFIAAKEAGLISVPHAGENEGPKSVWGAINDLHADRLGHGVRSMEDPELLTLLKERQIPLEVNLVSNICLHVYRSLAEHSFPHLDRMGLLLTINTDDPPLFNTNLLREYQVLVDEYGYQREDIIRIARNAFLASGAEDDLKYRLLTEFDARVQKKLQKIAESY
jgi:aminodeoxyfutalosine deaminase